MADAWVWDMYRPARFVKSAKVLTFRDVSIEEITHSDLEVPKSVTAEARHTLPQPSGTLSTMHTYRIPLSTDFA